MVISYICNYNSTWNSLMRIHCRDLSVIALAVLSSLLSPQNCNAEQFENPKKGLEIVIGQIPNTPGTRKTKTIIDEIRGDETFGRTTDVEGTGGPKWVKDRALFTKLFTIGDRVVSAEYSSEPVRNFGELKVGKKITVPLVLTETLGQSQREVFRGTLMIAVERSELVTVAREMFDVFVILHRLERVGPSGTQIYIEDRYWYAPRIRWFVRHQRIRPPSQAPLFTLEAETIVGPR